LASILDTIGNTPLVKLKISEHSNSNVFGKLELQNPFGMKDRVAKHSLLKAKREGVLKSGVPIIESSSGTMACGLSLVGTYLGHDVHVVTDPRIDSITLSKLYSLGSIIHIVENMGDKGWQGSRLEYLSRLLNDMPNAYWPKQYENADNPNSYKELAQELIQEIGKIDILVAPVGSGGCISGTARELKKYNHNLKVVAVDSIGSVIFGQPDNPKRIQGGLGNSIVAKNVDFQIIDQVHWLNNFEAFSATQKLANVEKIYAGNSSGSSYKVAEWLSKISKRGTNIVVIFPDRGDRYHNTVYNNDFLNKIGKQEKQNDPRFVNPNTVVDSWSYSDNNKRGVLYE